MPNVSKVPTLEEWKALLQNEIEDADVPTTTVAQGLAADIILGALAFKALGVIINGINKTLTIYRKMLHLNKDIFLYENLTFKPGETITILGNINEKDRGISLTDKIADPKIAIRKTAQVKREPAKLKFTTSQIKRLKSQKRQ
jgi:hypothetical protein